MKSPLNLKLTKEEQFLCQVLVHRDYLNCDRIVELFESVGEKRLLQTCRHNKISTIAYDALSVCGVSAELGDWKKDFVEMEVRISSYMDALESTAKLLEKEGIQLLALKNSGITRGLYPYYGSCPMGDIDVLVKRSDFKRAHEILTKNGFTMKFRSPLEREDIEHAFVEGGAEYQVNLPNGDKLWFELQWRPISGRWIQPSQEPKADELIDSSVAIEGCSTRLLGPEDNLLQVCLHTAKHTYVRAPGFRLHTDVDRIVRTCEIDWDLFLSKVVLLKVKTAVYFSLAFAFELLNTPVSQKHLERIKPPFWKKKLITKWLQKVGLFDPDGKKWGRLGYVIFVSLLYDNFGGLLRGIFPEKNVIKEKYGIRYPWQIPFYYIIRLIDLALKRTLAK